MPYSFFFASHNEERGGEGTPGIVIFPYELAGKENEQPGKTYKSGARPHEGTYSLLPCASDQNQSCAVIPHPWQLLSQTLGL